MESDLIAASSRFTPIYFRIQEGLRRRITSGELKPGDRLPSETELADAFSTTRATVQRALQQLVFEGLIVRKSGSGSFVADPPSVASVIDTRMPHAFEDQVAAHGRPVTYRLLSFKRQKCSAKIAERLKIASSESVWRMERLRLIEDRPVCVEQRYFLDNLGAKVTQTMLERRSAHGFLSAITGERVPTITVSVTAEIASRRIADFLEISEGSAVLIRDNAHHNCAGMVLQWGLSIYRGDIRLNYVLGTPLPSGAAQ
jgi:GntR family transcriptional regulator